VAAGVQPERPGNTLQPDRPDRSAILDGLATLQRLLTPDTVERGAR
jgi:hypothetical protein